MDQADILARANGATNASTSAPAPLAAPDVGHDHRKMTRIDIARIDAGLLAGLDGKTEGSSLYEFPCEQADRHYQLVWTDKVGRAGVVVAGPGLSGAAHWADAVSPEDAMQRFLADGTLGRLRATPDRKGKTTTNNFNPSLLRGLTVTAATVGAGLLAYWIADGVLHLLAACTVLSGGGLLEPEIHCTDPGNAPAAFGCLGALVGFWFAYTGRFARLFQKV
jgi:hypothetical protein